MPHSHVRQDKSNTGGIGIGSGSTERTSRATNLKARRRVPWGHRAPANAGRGAAAGAERWPAIRAGGRAAIGGAARSGDDARCTDLREARQAFGDALTVPARDVAVGGRRDRAGLARPQAAPDPRARLRADAATDLFSNGAHGTRS